MKKNFLKISAAILLSISLVGCGAKQSTENKQAEQKTEVVEGQEKILTGTLKLNQLGKSVLILRKILERVLLQILLN